MSVSQPLAGAAYHRTLTRTRGVWWRLMVSSVLGVVGLLVMSVLAAAAVFAIARLLGYSDFTFDSSNGIDAGEMLATNLGLASLILVAGGLVRLLYGVLPRWLSSIRPGLRWRWLVTCVAMASVVWLLFLVLGTVGAFVTRSSPLDIGVVAFVVVVLLTTPLQAAGEEYLFRGLLLQALGAARIPTWLCCGLSGALFATAHLQFAPPLFADRFLLGAVLAGLAIRTGGLEAGIAIHTVKNVAVLIPAGILGDVGDALDPTSVTWVPLVLDAVLLAIIVPWIIAIARRRERALPASGAPAGYPPLPPPAPPAHRW